MLNTPMSIPKTERQKLAELLEHQMFGAAYHARQIANGTETLGDMPVIQQRLEASKEILRQLRLHVKVKVVGA